MVKLVGVYQGHQTRSRDCLSRRQLPLEIESDLTMVMALDDFCMACGPDHNMEKSKSTPDVDHFLRNYSCLTKDELSACLMVTGEEILSMLGRLVACVGCRRAVETLYHTLQESGDSALDPLVITKDGVVSVNREHLEAPDSLANLFCRQTVRLSSIHLSPPSGKRNLARRGGRCASHTLGQKKFPSGLSSCGSWLDTWDCMEAECREEVVLLPFSAIRVTLDKYLKKHSFCSECTSMVNRAYTLLVEEGQEPAKAAGEKPANCDDKLNEDGSLNLYSGISACTKDGHIHVQSDPCFIAQLFVLAEPELSGLKQERHAKTIEIAQKEVLTCIGITLFQRFLRIEQKLREGEQSCDILLLVVLKTLRQSLDISAESKRGVTDLELLCEELDREDRAKERKRIKKKEKRSKQQLKKRENKAGQAPDVSSRDTVGNPTDSSSQPVDLASLVNTHDDKDSNGNDSYGPVCDDQFSKVKDSVFNENKCNFNNNRSQAVSATKGKTVAGVKSVSNSLTVSKNGCSLSGTEEAYDSEEEEEDNDAEDSDSGMGSCEGSRGSNASINTSATGYSHRRSCGGAGGYSPCCRSEDSHPLGVEDEEADEEDEFKDALECHSSPACGANTREGCKPAPSVSHCNNNYLQLRNREQGQHSSILPVTGGLSLIAMLDESGYGGSHSDPEDANGSDSDQEGIPLEEIEQFRNNLSQVNLQREKLRENLRKKFAEMCCNCRPGSGKLA